MSASEANLPTPRPSDDEDVVWGLSTASALWTRGERRDAIVWLRRAIDAATGAGQSERASELDAAVSALERALLVPPPAPSDVGIDVDVDDEAETIAEEPPDVRAAIDAALQRSQVAAPPSSRRVGRAPPVSSTPPPAPKPPFAPSPSFAPRAGMGGAEPPPKPPENRAGAAGAPQRQGRAVGPAAGPESAPPASSQGRSAAVPAPHLVRQRPRTPILDPWAEPVAAAAPTHPIQAEASSEVDDDDVITSALPLSEALRRRGKAPKAGRAATAAAAPAAVPSEPPSASVLSAPQPGAEVAAPVFIEAAAPLTEAELDAADDAPTPVPR